MHKLQPKIRQYHGHEIALLDCSGHAFPRHFHEEYVICLNLAGHESIWVEGRTLEAEAGDFTLYNPGEVQASHATTREWTFLALYITPAFMNTLFGPDAHPLFECSVLNARPLANSCRRILSTALQKHHEEEEIAEQLALLLPALLRASSKHQTFRLLKDTHKTPPNLDLLMQRMLDDMACPPALSELAALAGVTPVQLTRMFKRATGLPPMQWLMNQRLHQTRRALASNEPLAEIAASHGFADQAHFTRRFRALFGITPGAWRRALRS